MFRVDSELSSSGGGRVWAWGYSGARGRGGAGVGGMALALVLLALCGARGAAGGGDEEYGGLGMPNYDYDVAPDMGRRGAGGAEEADEYPERDAHSLDYKYEEGQPRGRNDRTYYAKQSKASDKWQQNKKSEKATANRDLDYESSDKYNNDDTTDKFNPESKRKSNSISGIKGSNMRRRSGVSELLQRTPPNFSRKKAEDPSEHPVSRDLVEPKTRPRLDLEDDESHSFHRIITSRKRRRKPRNKSQPRPEVPKDIGENSEHWRGPARTNVRSREEDWKGPEEDEEEEEETNWSAATRTIPSIRKRNLKHEESDDFENEDIKLEDERQLQEVGAVKDNAPPRLPAVAGQEQLGDDYDDYPMNIEKLARTRTMLERVLGGYTTTETSRAMAAVPATPAPPPVTHTTTFKAITTALSKPTTTGEPLTATSTATPAVSAIVTDTTPTLITQAPDPDRELFVAEKSPLSIQMKSQKKDSLEASMLKKPVVLRQVTTDYGGQRAGVERAGTTLRFELSAQQAGLDSPEMLARVKGAMRERLMSRASSLLDLTDDWDGVVCDYVDEALLRASGPPYTSRTPRTAPPSVLLCFATLLMFAVC